MFQFFAYWYVLAGAVVVYWMLPSGWRLGFLAIASMVFVATLAPLDAAGILVWTLLFYWIAPLALSRKPELMRYRQDGAAAAVMSRTAENRPTASAGEQHHRRWILWTLIASLVAYTVSFKYAPAHFLNHFAASQVRSGEASPASTWLLPLGISYLSCFTFKFIHYAIEVARGNIKDRSLAHLLCYAFLFPIFVMGPIERFDHFLSSREGRCSRQAIAEGLTRIILGLIKWCVLGELFFGEAYHRAVAGELLGPRLHTMNPLKLWWTAIEVYFYGYMNFAGYSDIAIGSSRLFGLRIMENFNWPILATNPANFWKRWHMTLTGWCMTYVFMPVLGFTRRPNFSTYAAFVVIGLWHGLSWPWVAWGLYHGTGVVVFGAWIRYRRRRGWKWAEHSAWNILGIAATILFIAVGDMLTFGGAHSMHDMRRLFTKLAWMNVK